MSEKYYDSDSPEGSNESTKEAKQPTEITDVGKQSLRGVLDYSIETQNAILSINEQPIEKHPELVARLQKENPKAWKEIGQLGGISKDGIIGPDGDILIQYPNEWSIE